MKASGATKHYCRVIDKGKVMTALEKSMIDMAIAFISYAGPLDDPRVGWIGIEPSRLDLFRCERCGEEHEDCTQIPHRTGCSAKALLDKIQIVIQTKDN